MTELLSPDDFRTAERGRAVRSAVGVTSLPGGACLELELTGLIVD